MSFGGVASSRLVDASIDESEKLSDMSSEISAKYPASSAIVEEVSLAMPPSFMVDVAEDLSGSVVLQGTGCPLDVLHNRSPRPASQPIDSEIELMTKAMPMVGSIFTVGSIP